MQLHSGSGADSRGVTSHNPSSSFPTSSPGKELSSRFYPLLLCPASPGHFVVSTVHCPAIAANIPAEADSTQLHAYNCPALSSCVLHSTVLNHFYLLTELQQVQLFRSRIQMCTTCSCRICGIQPLPSVKE